MKPQEHADIYYLRQMEQEILGRILQKPELFYQVSDQLDHEDFSDMTTRTVYTAMGNTARTGKPPTIELIKGNLKEMSYSDILAIQVSVASTSDIQYYVDIVKDAGKTRKLQRTMEKALLELKKKPRPEVMETLQKELYDLNRDTLREKAVDNTELMNTVLSRYEEGIRTEGKSMGMMTGWWDLDKSLKGLKRGHLVIVGGRTSIGKTAFTLSLATMMMKDYKVLMFELEMEDFEIGDRQVASKSGVALDLLMEPHTMSQEHLSRMSLGVNKIAERNNFVLDTNPRITLEHIRNRIRFEKETKGLDVVIVDHIGLMPTPRGYSSKNEWLGEITASLKGMAKEFSVNIIAVSQLNRGVELRTEKRPQLADLRDSGNLEQDADVVMLLYRDGYYNPEMVTSDVEPFEVIIAKNRGGRVGKVEMAINLKIQRVTEMYKT